MPCEVAESHIITVSLESNRQIKINFDGGDLSSDAGLLLIKEFVSKLGIDKLFSHSFKTNDSASFRYHTDKENGILCGKASHLVEELDEITRNNKVDYERNTGKR